MATMPPPAHASRGRAALLVLALLALVGGSLALALGARAEDPVRTELRYLAINGDGPSARAWYDGAPPTGVPVQDALNTFAAQGFTVSEVSQGLVLGTADAPPTRWSILLERTN